jgi:hypothetical protein
MCTSFDDATPLLKNCERMMNLPKKPSPYIGLAGLLFSPQCQPADAKEKRGSVKGVT